MSTSFPENMSIKLVLRLKIERFEISEREKKNFFFPDPDNTRRSAFKPWNTSYVTVSRSDIGSLLSV